MTGNKKPGEKLFDIANIALMLALVFLTFYPMYYVLCASVSNNALLQANAGMLIAPIQFTLGAYKLAFQHPMLMSGYRNTLVILACSLPLNILMTLLAGYFMATKGMALKKPILVFIMIPMFFSGGLVPAYLNQRSLGLYDNLWAIILPGALSIYNAIIAKTAMENLPDALRESAYIDGANEAVILFAIIAPLITPTICVLLLYYGVGHWNSWFSATIYLKQRTLMPVQVVLRMMLIENSDVLNASEVNADKLDSYTETIKFAAIIITTLPILCVYPFLQKYFVKGVMIGAVKG